ncbi:hypothetical protein L3049_14080 [Labilibaculum sp. DW002]|uniref:Uncharacterized protein n=1 Tax=Paralabilibaculum antarcticum TaxID=2912572 RepID=A0ABT5VUM9_9BACT|nr:hypothetical protein [Labilibaculum sp. DW002]MDE5419124.1 hypothetical protein [Labilibaculum sp. DW002]
MATPDIKGFFSQEHSVLVFLICASLWANWQLHLTQNEIKSELKLITYRLNNGSGEKQNKKLASFNLYGCEGKPQFQAASPFIACFLNNRERLAKGKHRIY